jgi:hypothetical protein
MRRQLGRRTGTQRRPARWLIAQSDVGLFTLVGSGMAKRKTFIGIVVPLQRLLEISHDFGYWLGSPADNAVAGISFPGTAPLSSIKSTQRHKCRALALHMQSV